MLFNKALNPHFIEVQDVLSGHTLKVKAQFDNVKIVSICLYAPVLSKDRIFFRHLSDAISSYNTEEHLFLGGDFNCTEHLDASPGAPPCFMCSASASYFSLAFA